MGKAQGDGCRQSLVPQMAPIMAPQWPPKMAPQMVPLMDPLLSRQFKFSEANERMSLSNAQTMKSNVRIEYSYIDVRKFQGCSYGVTRDNKRGSTKKEEFFCS